jgi:hypothetical protein
MHLPFIVTVTEVLPFAFSHQLLYDEVAQWNLVKMQKHLETVDEGTKVVVSD